MKIFAIIAGVLGIAFGGSCLVMTGGSPGATGMIGWFAVFALIAGIALVVYVLTKKKDEQLPVLALVLACIIFIPSLVMILFFWSLISSL